MHAPAYALLPSNARVRVIAHARLAPPPVTAQADAAALWPLALDVLSLREGPVADAVLTALVADLQERAASASSPAALALLGV